MSSRIERIEECLAYGTQDNPWVRLYFDRVRFPGGREGRYNRIVENEGRPGVAVLMIHRNRVALVRQHRYPVDRMAWEIPRGFGEGNDPRLDAVREVTEETGIVVGADALVDLGRLEPNSGLLATVVQIYRAVLPDTVAPLRPTDGEIAEFRWVEWSTLDEWIANDVVRDSITMGAILRNRLTPSR
jgi:ADP-ribose pyrophosphatase